MAKNEPLATGRVESLTLNGLPVSEIVFTLGGPQGDRHYGFGRPLSDHDGAYIRTSSLEKGDGVFNWRSWTGLSCEEITAVEKAIGHNIPIGTLLENVTFSGIPDFSKLPPASRIVCQPRKKPEGTQVILAVWEENGPCKTVAQRLEEHHDVPKLRTQFIKHAQGKRGVMGFVLASGIMRVGDRVTVYPPVE